MFTSLDYVDDGRGRPYSAPAVMAGNGQATGTPESESAVLEYFSNKGEGQAGATNPRIPRSGLGSRFSVDQVSGLRSSAAAVGALTAIGKTQYHTDSSRQEVADDDEDDAPLSLVKMSDDEIQRDAQRRYRPDNTTESPPTSTLGDFVEAQAAAPHDAEHSRTADAEGTVPTKTMGLFSRLADSHRRALDSKVSTLRAAKSHATILSEQQRLLTRRSEAAIVMQRAVRQLLIGACGVRLLALLHILRTEAAAPRYPMIVGRAVQDGKGETVVVTPLMYLLEVTLEYEYFLYVENVARRLVVDTANAEAGAASQQRHRRQYVRRSMLSGAEVSDLHDVVQQRLSSGEIVVSRYQLRRGVGSLVTPRGEATWCAHICDAVTQRSSSHALSRESFLHTIAQDAVLRQRTQGNVLDDGASSTSGRPATPTWSYHSGATPSQRNSTTQSSSSDASVTRSGAHPRETLVDRYEEATWEQPQSSSELRSKQQQLRMAAAYRASHIPLEAADDVVALIHDTPQEWFVAAGRGVTRDAVIHGALGTAPSDLSAMPLLQPTLPTPQAPPSAAPSSNASSSNETVETQLAALWAGHDPELASQERRSKRLARRRFLGAEADVKSDSSDDDTAHNASAKVAFVEPSQLEFDSAAQRADRERRERDLRKRIEAAVATSVALKAEVLRGESRFDPATWGLDESVASMRQAATVLAAADGTALSRPDSRSSNTTDVSLRNVHKVVVRIGGGAGAGRGNEEAQECAICEMDAVDVHVCSCGGNWVHRECSFGFDVDAPVSKSAAVKCCRLCKPAMQV
ncbi:Hypothetical protein, putative [Bodo saltans]|uniref:Zinc finger protein n=1 Tax=Bodo saltans TaxID=75058 RepID=A0A0S4ITG3_BODSA|nr:Hypothetical protein, putative [Bodo saltans]|eukprot:CUF82746.1 Hypothetical protein, putative [Bodo saltans]